MILTFFYLFQVIRKPKKKVSSHIKLTKINQNNNPNIILKVVIAEEPETEYVWKTIRTDPSPEPIVRCHIIK